MNYHINFAGVVKGKWKKISGSAILQNFSDQGVVKQ